MLDLLLVEYLVIILSLELQSAFFLTNKFFFLNEELRSYVKFVNLMN